MSENNLIRLELFKTVDKFMNEIELTMDYLDKNTVSSVRKYMEEVDKNEDKFKQFVEYTNLHLKTFEVQISAVLFSNKKIKSNYYAFLNGVSLFNNILHFRVFENESKNTKKDLIKYLYSMYMSCVFLSKDQDELSNESVLNDRLNEFVLKIRNEAETALKDEDIKQPRNKVRRNAIVADDKMKELLANMPNMPGMSGNPLAGIPGMSGMGDIGNIMESILGNKEILNIATDISQKMQTQNLNPMTMLSSLMSGNIESGPLQGLVEEIQQKVETKINSGEINKENLENQAKNIMGSISSNPDALNSMGGMSDMIKNMVNELEKNNK